MIESHTYRADIDGLRALAILPVVLFHAGVPGFSGGFVGVDVFFVISGYLITSIIEREIRAGHFSLIGFYERRVRRILPALLAVLLASALVAPLLLYPTEAQSFARSLIAATLFASSFLFRRESGYFDLDAELKPLLHTWSLSVEEIFYIVFPWILLLRWQRWRRRRVWLLVGIALVSFAASVIALAIDPGSKSAFYLPHFRAWEFLIGALIALTSARLPQRHAIADLAAWVGLLMIAIAVFAYSESTTFPGVTAVLPCLGAAMIILGGQQRPSAVGRVLSLRPVVFIGLVSYSLYLWHWPLIVFSRQALGRAPEPVETALLIAASLLIATLSWRYVERPFRGKSGVLRREQLFAAAGAAALVLIGIGVHGTLTGGWLGRYPAELATILASSEDRDPRRRECLNTRADASGCLYGQPGSAPVLALWGDSHAAVYAVMLGELARGLGSSILVITMPACPPLLGWQGKQQVWRDACERFQRLAWQRIVDTPSIHTVVVSARFNGYPIADPAEGFAAALAATTQTLLDAGKRVALVYTVPELGRDVPKALGEALLAGSDPAAIGVPRAQFLAEHRVVFETLDALGDRPGLVRIYPHTSLCDQTVCHFYRDGRALHSDEHHLSLTGAGLLAPLFRPLFDHSR